MTNNLRSSAQRVQDLLSSCGLTTKVVEFSDVTRTAEDAARTIGCMLGQIAKTIIFKGKNSGNPICVIASGPNRVDERKIEQFLQEPIEKPDAGFVLQHTGFAIGGIPPIGYVFAQPPIIDEDLLAYQEVWAAAGTPFAVFSITPANLVKITSGTVHTVKK